MPVRPKYFYNYFWVTFLTVLLAGVLTILRVPILPVDLWPSWLLLAVIYLVFTRPNKYGIYFGFIIGLLNDLLIGSTLGLHALTFTGICYILLKLNQRLAFLPLIQQCLLIFGLILIDRLAIGIIKTDLFTASFVSYAILASVITVGCLLILIRFFGSRSQLLKWV
ncbi:MAG: rod shape-determining protein MreD [Gammaproteobacteria bacterium]|nr:rod shape-determining protein MreD [Gammaproteobacteria bacterium]